MFYIVRDRFTHKEIYRGTKQDCLNYVTAFGLCYSEPLIV